MNKKSGFRGSGMGVGYVSVMIIFVTVCLTLFAVLSLRAASSNDSFNERSGEYLKMYYAADSEAKRILSRLDKTAGDAVLGGFFEDDFEMSAGEGIEVLRTKGGCTAKYSVNIDERRALFAEVLFLSDGGFEIKRWQSVVVSDDFGELPGDLWNGKFDGGLFDGIAGNT